MNKNDKTNELLSAWEETYKKGQLTFWIFFSLKDDKKYAEEIKSFVKEKTQNTMTCEDQSLYRILRKYEYIGVLDYEMGKGNKGPERKYYYLTDLGNELFHRFVKRNISLFYSDEIKQLLNY
ncbi:MAG: PadR family transcriptional regulator [Bacteroidales bacterium]|jgi:DNA-binding PadR family transcriptional regulator|nr:PadR family transcriptional regulator [Bacteroidales bacterium]